jgi:hypothetical protein
MEQRRKFQYIEELRVEIMRAEKVQARDSETVKNINRLNINKDILDVKKTQISQKIAERAAEIENMKTKIADIESGKLDAVLLEESKRESKSYHDSHTSMLQKRREAHDKEKEMRDTVYKKPREKENKHIEKDYAYYLKVHNSIGDTLPDNMRENLRTMPNNKGYIWRGCLFCGLLPPERGQPYIAFEKLRGGITRIHETDEYETRIYEKYGKEKKQLVSRKPRNNYKLGRRSNLVK